MPSRRFMFRVVALAPVLTLVAALLLTLLAANGAAQSQTPPPAPTRRLITEAVDPSRMVTLRGNTRPEANSANDRGAVPSDLPLNGMELQLRLPAEKQQELDQLTRDQQNPASPNYHQWLTPAQFQQRFSLAPEDVEAVTAWLKSQGFTVSVINPQSIVFSGTAGQVRSAFRTEIHNLDVKGEKHIANMSDPQIPAALAPAVAGVVSLNDFKPRAMNRPRAAFTTATGLELVVPADLATIYNLNPLFAAGYSGQGQTIVVVEPSDLYSNSDWDTFRSTFGLTASYPNGSLTLVHPSGTGANNCTDPGTNGADVEATLDAEWASAAAPNATIEVASCADTTTPGLFIALANLVNDADPPSIVSISYLESETQIGAAGNAFIDALYQQGASEGISIFACTGDDGAAASDEDAVSATHGIGVSGLASTPYNVAVGGTDFEPFDGPVVWGEANSSNYGSALSYVPESPWDDSCANGAVAELILQYYPGSGQFGPLSFCNTAIGEQYFLVTAAGSGGPSGCATGASTTSGVVGGTCAGYAKPAWQSLTGNPNDGVRDIPDVSLFAGNGVWGHYYVFCWSDPAYSADGSAPCTGTPDTWSGGGGTSFSTPVMAAIQALVNQKTLEERQGNPDPIYYRLAAIGGPNDCSANPILTGCIFHDIQSGDIDVNCTGTIDCFYGSPPVGANGVLSTSSSADQPAFTANFGWDFATGIGSVDAYALAFNWPNSIAPTSGTPQSTTILTAFGAPFVVIVKDTEGNPIGNLTVTFTAPSSGASGTFAGGVNTAVTNSSGMATSAVFTANAIAGSYTLTATAPSITGAANFTLTNSPGAPASIGTVSLPQSAAINNSFGSGLVAVVKDVGGNELNGVTVTFTVPTTGPSASFAGGVNTATTLFMGEASSAVLTANGIAGTYSVTASVAGVTQPASFLLSNTATAAANITAVSGTPQSATIFSPFAAPLVAKVTDGSGNPVAGSVVRFFAPGFLASGTFTDGIDVDTELTNTGGIATSTTFTANGSAGGYTVLGNAFTGSEAAFSMTNIAGPPANIVPYAPNPQSAVIGTTFPYQISVTVTDAGGNPLTGVPVTFSAPPGGAAATFAGSLTYSTVTNLGIGTTPLFTANSTVGPYAIQATAAGVAGVASFPLLNVDFSLAQHTPGVVQVTAGTPATTRLDMASIPANTPMPAQVPLTCTVPGSLTNASCYLSPPGFYPGQALSAITVTILTRAGATSSLSAPLPDSRRPGSAQPEWIYLFTLFAMGIAIFAIAHKRRLHLRYITLAMALFVAAGLLSCGGGGGSGDSTNSSTSTSTPSAPVSPDSPTPLGPSSVTVSTIMSVDSKSVTIPINVN